MEVTTNTCKVLAISLTEKLSATWVSYRKLNYDTTHIWWDIMQSSKWYRGILFIDIRWDLVLCMWISSVRFSRSVVSDSLWPHGLQLSRLSCPSPTPGVCSDSCPLSQWCLSTISSSAVPFSSYLQSFTASGSLPMSQFLASGGQSFGASASASLLLMNIQYWFPLGLAGLISLQSKGMWIAFANNVY